jgi:hypothetical protein
MRRSKWIAELFVARERSALDLSTRPFHLRETQDDQSRRGGNSGRVVGCRASGRPINRAIERKTGDELHDFPCRDIRQRQRKNIEFHGGRKERGPARCRRFEFGCPNRAERRQAPGSSLGLPTGFQAEVISPIGDRGLLLSPQHEAERGTEVRGIALPEDPEPGTMPAS